MGGRGVTLTTVLGIKSRPISACNIIRGARGEGCYSDYSARHQKQTNFSMQLHVGKGCYSGDY